MLLVKSPLKKKTPYQKENVTVIRRQIPSSLERIEINHDIKNEEKYCTHCDKDLTEIKSIVVEQVAYCPGCLYVKKHIRHRYACRCCSQTIITAAMPNQPIEKSDVEVSLLVQIIIDKYADHIPLYRQALRWLRAGMSLSRSTLCDWSKASAVILKPLVLAMKVDLLMQAKIHTDDTTIPVLAKGKTHTGRLCVYVGGGGYCPTRCVIYDYSPSRAGRYPKDFLQNYRGYLQADAYSGYDKLYEMKMVVLLKSLVSLMPVVNSLMRLKRRLKI